jgi:hypothetical protein
MEPLTDGSKIKEVSRDEAPPHAASQEDAVTTWIRLLIPFVNFLKWD